MMIRLKCNFIKTKILAFALLFVFEFSGLVDAQPGTLSGTANEKYPGQKVIEYLNLDAPEYLRQKELKNLGLQEIAPVMLPEGKFEARGEAEDYHFAWPHAGIIDDVLFVGFRLDQPRSVLGRSTDGGKSWEPLFLENARILVFGSTKSGKVVAAAGNGSNTLSVLTSEDKGKTWKRHNASVSNMPRVLHARIIEHPKFGLITGGHFTTSDSLKFLQSEDEGQTWRSVSFHVDQPVSNNGTVVFLDGDNNLGVFVRHHAGFGDWKSFAQFTAINEDTTDRFEHLIWKGKYTNQWVRKTDGSDVIYNPVSQRIEAVTTKRDWGFPHLDRGYMTLNLWSISPESFHKGEKGESFWRYEGTILKSGGEKARIVNPRDGMHPVGSVIDEKRGVQHIFIYSGDRAHGGNPAAPNTGRTGIFRITRTLDTEKWVEKNRELENYKKIYQVNEDFSTLAQWNKSGSPAGGEMIIPRTEPPYRVEVNFLRGGMKADEMGHLYINTGKPGYYGLHNEQIIATSNFRVEFKAKVKQFPSSGYPLAISVNCGAEKNDVIIKEDGIYQLGAEEWDKPQDMKNLKKIIDISIDNEWHTWEIEVKQGQMKISLDGVHIGKGSTRIDGRLGHRPISISAMTTSEDDVAVSVVDYFKFENIEL